VGSDDGETAGSVVAGAGDRVASAVAVLPGLAVGVAATDRAREGWRGGRCRGAAEAAAWTGNIVPAAAAGVGGGVTTRRVLWCGELTIVPCPSAVELEADGSGPTIRPAT
jgi:hypothetical protein